jgi:hypothetical protein
MAERVVPLQIDARWEPNAPAAVLVVTEAGLAALALRPHLDDADHDYVVFVWSGTYEAAMGVPNDEALSGHRLYTRGLAQLAWAGVVEHSERIADLERRNRVHARHNSERFRRLRHYVLPLKESMVEVVADSLEMQRHPGPTLQAASLALQSS